MNKIDNCVAFIELRRKSLQFSQLENITSDHVHNSALNVKMNKPYYIFNIYIYFYTFCI